MNRAALFIWGMFTESSQKTSYMIPDVLQNIPGITEHNFKLTKGIYFLFLKGELVYVGRSLNVYARIQQHVDERIKEFDHSFIQLVGSGISLSKLERQYIIAYSPKYNYEIKQGHCLRPEPMTMEQFRMEGKRISQLL